jgi:hypothetical protein
LFSVLSPDLKIVAVSDGYFRVTMTQRHASLVRVLFEVFPDFMAGGVRSPARRPACGPSLLPLEWGSRTRLLTGE